MEQDPNLFAQGQAGRQAIEKTLAVTEQDSPRDAATKRRALQRWYHERSQAARRRYLEWMNRRALEREVGTSDVTQLGRYALDKMAKVEQDKHAKPRHRLEVVRLWKRLLRRRTQHAVTEGTQFARPRRSPWTDKQY